jgi:hypothetical protein
MRQSRAGGTAGDSGGETAGGKRGRDVREETLLGYEAYGMEVGLHAMSQGARGRRVREACVGDMREKKCSEAWRR